MLVLVDDERIAFFLRDRDRNDLFRQTSIFHRRRRALLTAQRKSVLVHPRDPEIDGNILGRLGHRVDAIFRLHQRIHESPADGRVVDLRRARKRGLGLAHHERRTRHAFDTAGDHERCFSAFDGARGDGDGIHARAAQPIDGRPRDLVRHSREQQRHARHVAVIFAGLVGAAVDDFVDR